MHYVSWLGVPSLPKFNWRAEELRRRFIDGLDSIVARWLRPPFSLDGWRVDVANMTGRYRDEDLNERCGAPSAARWRTSIPTPC